MKRLLSLSILMAAFAATDPYFREQRINNTKPYPKKVSLPKWKFGENYIFAKNESDAIKYAKKRGLYKEGDVPIKID